MSSKQEERIEKALENLFRVVEFRHWVQSNALFPIVPDSVVHPMVQQLKLAEHTLLTMLYDYDALERVAKMQKVTASGAMARYEAP